MLHSLSPTEPNPKAYPIEGAPYGATMAYPNLASARVIARELAEAREWGVRPVEVSEGAGEELRRRIASELADRDCLYAVTLTGGMFVIPAEVQGKRTYHTMAVNGEDVIAAGHVRFDSQGRVRTLDDRSGHYRPDERQANDVAHSIFKFAGLLQTGEVPPT